MPADGEVVRESSAPSLELHQLQQSVNSAAAVRPTWSVERSWMVTGSISEPIGFIGLETSDCVAFSVLLYFSFSSFRAGLYSQNAFDKSF